MTSRRTKRDTGFIYAISDPDTGKIRYIGQTINYVEIRLRNHLYTCRYEVYNHLYKWMRQILSENKLPIIEIIEEAPTEMLNELEIFYIVKAKELGWDLVNGTSGGEGTKNLSVESRLKMSIASRNHKPPSIEARKKMSFPGKKHPMYGKRHTEESLRKMSLIKIGKIFHRKLTDKQIIEIKNLLKSNITQSEIAKRFNVSRRAIYSIKYNKTWKKIN